LVDWFGTTSRRARRDAIATANGLPHAFTAFSFVSPQPHAPWFRTGRLDHGGSLIAASLVCMGQSLVAEVLYTTPPPSRTADEASAAVTTAGVAAAGGAGHARRRHAGGRAHHGLVVARSLSPRTGRAAPGSHCPRAEPACADAHHRLSTVARASCRDRRRQPN